MVCWSLTCLLCLLIRNKIFTETVPEMMAEMDS